jgi:hypothetical protein
LGIYGSIVLGTSEKRSYIASCGPLLGEESGDVSIDIRTLLTARMMLKSQPIFFPIVVGILFEETVVAMLSKWLPHCKDVAPTLMLVIGIAALTFANMRIGHAHAEHHEHMVRERLKQRRSGGEIARLVKRASMVMSANEDLSESLLSASNRAAGGSESSGIQGCAESDVSDSDDGMEFGRNVEMSAAGQVARGRVVTVEASSG